MRCPGRSSAARSTSRTPGRKPPGWAAPQLSPNLPCDAGSSGGLTVSKADPFGLCSLSDHLDRSVEFPSCLRWCWQDLQKEYGMDKDGKVLVTGGGGFIGGH